MSDPTDLPVAAPGADFNFAQHLLALNAGRPDKAAFIDDLGTLTFRALDERVRRLASGLRGLGIKREERVLLLMQDVNDWPVSFLGAMHAGIVQVAVNTLLTADDYAYMLEHSRAQAVLVSGALLPTLNAALVKSDHEVGKVIVSRPVAAAFCAGACAARKASSSTSDGCSGATGRDTITLPTSWSDLTSAALSVGSSAPDTSTACARECSSM